VRNWKQFVYCVVVIMFLFTLTGCGQPAAPAAEKPAVAAPTVQAAQPTQAAAPAAAPTTAPVAPAPTAAPEIKKGGDLIIAVPANSEPASFDGQIDPYQSTWLFDSFAADPLLILAPDGKFQPALATGWETSSDGNSWTFKLRNDVKFQDGTPFNAEAVKFNLDRVKDPALGSAQLGDDLGPIKSVEVVDEFTVKINYEKPWVTLLDSLRRMPFWSPEAVKKFGKTDFDKHLVGTGPFMFTEWVANDHATFKKWDGYGGWNPIQKHKGAAYLDSVTIKFIGEAAVLGSMVKTDNAHVTQELPAQNVADYKDSKDAKLITGYQAGTGLQWVMNLTKPPLNQLEVRQALLFATDQEDINNTLYDGLYLVMKGPLNNVHPCYWNGVETMYPFDPEKAKQLLEGAGWIDSNGDGIREAKNVPNVKDGTPLTVRFSALHHQEIGEALQLQYKQIGVDLKVEVIPGPVQLDRVQKHDFELMYERQRSPDPRILDQVWNSKYAKPGGWAWTGLKNADLDAILDKITTVSDTAERCKLSADAQKIIMENAAMLPTLSDPVFYAVSNQVKDFQMGAEGNWFFLNDTYVEAK
jgi:peptide/nickel transport system substrate-binding protein